MDLLAKKKAVSRFSNIFGRLHYKINFDLNNTSSFLLPTDLLRDNIRIRLFKIIAVNVENVFCTLVNEKSYVITEKYSKAIFFSLVKSIVQDFLMSFYGYKIDIHSSIIKESFYTNYILKDQQILLDIPLQIVATENSKLFRSMFVPVYNKAYANFIEALIDNLVVELANAVMFIILNEFSFIYEIRKHFYRSNFLSLRNVERFRNNINWQVRIKNFIKRPADMYNSQHGIWIIRTTGIYYRVIYANRSNELMELKQLSLFTLFSLETKDFVISRVDEVFYFFGSNIRYILTSIIGQVIGLVWRGIIEGLKK